MRWRGTAAGTAAASAVLVAVAVSGALSDPVYFLLCALGLAGMVAGALRHRPRAAGWWCIAAAYALWLLGDALLLVAPELGVDGSASALPYLAAYLPMGAGLVLLARDAGARSWRGAVLESSMVSVALTLLSCVLLVGPALARDVAGQDHALSVAYLVCDIVLVALAVHLLTGSAQRLPSHVLGAVGLVLVMLCDGSWVVVGTLEPLQDVLALGVLLSNLMWATAALHPRRADAEPQGGAAPVVLSGRRLAVLGAALLLPSVLLAVLVVVRHTSGDGWAATWQVWAVAVAGALMAVLVVMSMAEAVRALRSSLDALADMSRVLERQASHDPLTGLANRPRSRAQLATALRTARRHGRGTGLLFVDLDGFKAVNDTHGHRVGDDVLRTVAGRLTSCVRPGDVVGRLGGDEFVVVLTRLQDEADLVALAERVVQHLAAPLTSGGVAVSVGASVGAVFCPDGDVDPDVLLHEADTAAYRAKATGRGRVVLFDAQLRAELAARAELEAELRTAIDTDQLVLQYQPVVDLRTGTAYGVEALVRWQRPGHGLVGPGEFVPVAEASDLVCDLGRWVLRTAARQQARWAGLSPDGVGPVVSVNLAPRHLAQAGAVDDVAGAVAEAGADPRRFVVEVTETDLVDSGETVEHLRQLRALGVRVAIDDFGTGWTSIGQLQHLPCDVLKIDRTLVVSTEPGAAELLALVVRAGHAFGMLVVAEGVETAEHEAAVHAAGAELAQGWRWAPALPADALDGVVGAGGDLARLARQGVPVPRPGGQAVSAGPGAVSTPPALLAPTTP